MEWPISWNDVKEKLDKAGIATIDLSGATYTEEGVKLTDEQYAQFGNTSEPKFVYNIPFLDVTISSVMTPTISAGAIIWTGIFTDGVSAIFGIYLNDETRSILVGSFGQGSQS